MNIDLDGKKIAFVCWPDSETEKCRYLRAGYNCDGIHMSVTHYNDQYDFWIVEMSEDAEVARHNPRYVETILWA